MDKKVFKNREINLEETRVFVYYNKTKNLFVAKALEGLYKGKIVAQSKAFTLKGALFLTKGLEKIGKSSKIGVAGYIISSEEDIIEKDMVEAVFDEKSKEFTLKLDSNSSVYYSPLVSLKNNKFYCK